MEEIKKRGGKPKVEKEKYRGKKIIFRINEEELKLLEKLKDDGVFKHYSNFFRRCLRDANEARKERPARIDIEMIAQMRKIGVNINQISRNANQIKGLSPELLAKFENDVIELKAELGKVISKLS